MRWLLHTKWGLAAPLLSLVHINAELNSSAIGSAIFVMTSLGSLLAAAVSVVIKNVVILLDYCYWVWATTHAINDLNLDADKHGDYLKDEKDTQVYDTAHHRSYDKGKEDMRPPLLVQQSGKVSGSLSPSGGEMILFDSHCHLQKVSSMQATDRKVEAAKAAGVTSIAICATCPQDWDDVIFTSQHLSNNLMVVLNFGGELIDTRFIIILTLTTMLGGIAVISNFIIPTQFIPGFSPTTYWRRFVMEWRMSLYGNPDYALC